MIDMRNAQNLLALAILLTSFFLLQSLTLLVKVMPGLTLRM